MKFAVLAAVGLLAIPVLAHAQEKAPDIAGFYICDGKNPDGSGYRGTTEIKKVGETFLVRWTMDDGAIVGVGMWSNEIFAVSYFGGAPAVVVYKVEGDRLVGEWTMGGAEGETYSETLTKAPAPERPSTPPTRPEPPATSPQPERHRLSSPVRIARTW